MLVLPLRNHFWRFAEDIIDKSKRVMVQGDEKEGMLHKLEKKSKKSKKNAATSGLGGESDECDVKRKKKEKVENILENPTKSVMKML
ncbi:hypothetical protein H5410_017676 [Solanum commersonii]|uniref:Uncharacterized protein n=1 Tax=Solanum commersonii TaxID=4109 RepID=A0A9J6A118_SOLCO|nr:hypothetical protein H5410_017676 [Solanum commersonii]